MTQRNTGSNLTDRELSDLSGRLSMLLHAGISPSEGLELLLEENDSDPEKNSGELPFHRELLTGLLEFIREGRTLSEACALTEAFPSYFVQMLRLGEETGTLDDTMASLSVHYDREDAVSRAVRNAVLLPSVMALLVLVVVFVLLTRVLPVFNSVYAQIGAALTGIPAFFLRAGRFLDRFSLIFLILAVLLVGASVFLFATASGKAFGQRLASKLGLARKLRNDRNVCRFSTGLSIALHAGLSTPEGVRLAAGLISDPAFTKKADTLVELLEDGTELGTSLRASGIYSGIDAQLLMLAARTGDTEDVLLKIAASREEEIDAGLMRLLTVMEPALVIALSLIVGLILLSVMLPLTGIMAGL